MTPFCHWWTQTRKYRTYYIDFLSVNGEAFGPAHPIPALNPSSRPFDPRFDLYLELAEGDAVQYR